MRFVSHRGLRPTTAKIREALMAILRDRLDGCRFLDLYAGVGSVGLEAWRGGAARVVFVERDASAARVLRENVRSAGAGEACDVVVRDAVAAVRGLASERFDVVFLDPPYSGAEVARTLQALAEAGLLVPGGLVVAEHHHKDAVPETAGSLRCCRRQKYGETVLSFYAQDEGIAS